DSLHFIYVELPAFNKGWEEINNDKDRFLYCIKHLHEMDELPEGFTDGIWERFTRQCELAEMPAEIKEEYISTMTTEIDRRAQDLYAKREARKLREEIRKEREEMLKEKSQLREEKSQLREEKSQLREEKSQLREEKSQLSEERSQLSEERSQLSEEKKAARAGGREEGREEGRAEGRAEGELKAKHDAAGKLKAAGIPIDIICQCTGLCYEQIDKL
ncbi:MAG: PD-(D/E)XK nuclease family transposase, partial [Bacteroidaceae bacterium]|nr:PD-(D/E)XK nuclease family transposase [Bacteroidaceae bacterium]